MNVSHSVRRLNLDQFLATNSSATPKSSSQRCPEPAQALPMLAPWVSQSPCHRWLLAWGHPPFKPPMWGSVPWVTPTHRLTRNSATILDFRAAFGLVEAVGGERKIVKKLRNHILMESHKRQLNKKDIFKITLCVTHHILPSMHVSLSAPGSWQLMGTGTHTAWTAAQRVTLLLFNML